MQHQPNPIEALAGVAAVAIILVAFATMLLGLLTLTTVVAPGITSRAGGALRKHGIYSLGAGVLVFAVFVLLGKLGGKVPVIGLVIVCSFVIVLLLGLTSAAEDVGRRLAALVGKQGTRMTHLVTGWLTFAAAACVPFVGWFIVIPYVALSGIGSLVVAAIMAWRPAPPAAPSSPLL